MTRKSGRLTNAQPNSDNLTYDARYGSVGWKPRQRRKWNRKLPPIHPASDMPRKSKRKTQLRELLVNVRDVVLVAGRVFPKATNHQLILLVHLLYRISVRKQ